jgi:B9 domain-containing protein 1
VWNLPFDVTWTSTNAFGWPRMVVEVRHLDFLGREVVLGYGSMLVPTVPGRYIRYVRTFAPVSGSAVQGFLAWLTANRPEFVRPDFVTENKGREGTPPTPLPYVSRTPPQTPLQSPEFNPLAWCAFK